MAEAREWIDRLHLRKHPEGGYYRETYRSEERIAREHLPERFSGERAYSTAIYFLLERDDFSALHRLKQDEVWHFYEGAPLTVHVLSPDGGYSAIRLGRRLDAGELPQAVVKAGSFFGASVGGLRLTRWLAAPWPRASTSPTLNCLPGRPCSISSPSTGN